MRRTPRLLLDSSLRDAVEEPEDRADLAVGAEDGNVEPDDRSGLAAGAELPGEADLVVVAVGLPVSRKRKPGNWFCTAPMVAVIASGPSAAAIGSV